MIIVTSSVTKISVFKIFSVHITRKRKAGVFKFLGFRISELPLAPFSRQISMNRKNKAVFSIGA